MALDERLTEHPPLRSPTDGSPGTEDLARAVVATIAPGVVVAGLTVVLDPSTAVASALVLSAAVLTCWVVVQHVVRPLTAAIHTTRGEHARTQFELLEQRADQDLRARLERALRNADSEPAALRVGMRAVAEAAPDAEVSLLLNVPDEPRIGWKVDLIGGELDTADPVPGTPGCSALAEGTSIVATAASLEACAHLQDLAGEVSAACVPLRAAEGTIGTVCVTTAPGEPLDPATLERIEWIVERTGFRTAEHRVSRGPVATARPDPLTGLPGPDALRPHLRDMVRSLSPFCLARIEIDRFDDLETDEDADAALVWVAEALCETLRPDDMICRVEGGGFAAVLRQCSADQAASVMERMREGLVLLLTQEADLRVSCSAGVVESHQATSLDEIVDLATAACDRARSGGGNRVAISEHSNQPS